LIGEREEDDLIRIIELMFGRRQWVRWIGPGKSRFTEVAGGFRLTHPPIKSASIAKVTKMSDSDPTERWEEICDKLSNNIHVEFNALEAFNSLRLAGLRKQQRAESLLLKFVTANASPALFLSCLLQTPRDPGVVRAAAVNLHAIYHFPNFLTLPPECIRDVVTSPDVRRPPPDELDKLVLRVLKRHKTKCIALVRIIDFPTADWTLLNELQLLLRSLGKEASFPDLGRVIELRRVCPDPNRVEETEKALEEELAHLRAQWNRLQQLGK
jgi:hypothetical protein